MKKDNIAFIILAILCYCFGILTEKVITNRQVYDKECFSSLIEERDFLIKSNHIKFELILNYDGAINAADSIEEAFYLHKIDSIWSLEE